MITVANQKLRPPSATILARTALAPSKEQVPVDAWLPPAYIGFENQLYQAQT